MFVQYGCFKILQWECLYNAAVLVTFLFMNVCTERVHVKITVQRTDGCHSAGCGSVLMVVRAKL